MPIIIQGLLDKYVTGLQAIYGSHLKSVILYGSYARGDFNKESDIDIMILLDLPAMDIKKYRHDLSALTYDFYMDYDLDIKPIAKNEGHFHSWMKAYPFYENVNREGVKLFGAA